MTNKVDFFLIHKAYSIKVQPLIPTFINVKMSKFNTVKHVCVILCTFPLQICTNLLQYFIIEMTAFPVTDVMRLKFIFISYDKSWRPMLVKNHLMRV